MDSQQIEAIVTWIGTFVALVVIKTVQVINKNKKSQSSPPPEEPVSAVQTGVSVVRKIPVLEILAWFNVEFTVSINENKRPQFIVKISLDKP